MTSEASQRPGLPAVFALCVLGCVAYLVPQLLAPAGFVGDVDARCVAGGPIARAGLLDLLGGPTPLADLSFRVDHALAAGPDELPRIMHAHSLALHVLACVALLFLLHRLGCGRVPALLGAALFAIHPSLVDAVAVVGMRPAVLAGLCTILALLSVARCARGRSPMHAGAAALLAILTLAASPIALALPLLAAMVGVRVAGRGVPPAVGLAVPMVAMLLWQDAVRLADFDPAGVGAPLAAVVWPRTPGLLSDVPLAGVAGAAVGLGAVAALLCAAAALRRRQPTLAAGLGMVAIAALPGGWVGHGVPDVATYLVLAGAAATLAALRLPLAGHVGLGVLLLVFLVTAWNRVPKYRDGPTLWGSMPGSPLAQTLRAEQRARTPLDPERQAALEALRLHLPRLPVGRHRLQGQRALIRLLSQMDLRGDATLAAEELCRLADAIGERDLRLDAYLVAAECCANEQLDARVDEYVGRAAALAPDHPAVIAAGAERMFAALAASVEGSDRPNWLAADDPRAAPIRAQLRRALERDPRCYRALLLEGRVEEACGNVLSAMPLYKQAIELRPDQVGPRLLLAKLFAESDLADDAEMCVRKAMADGIEDPRLHYWLALLLSKTGRAADARQHLEAYVRNRGASQQARMLLANLLSAEALRQEDQVDPAELHRMATRIAELNPDDPKGYLVRAAVILKRKHPSLVDFRKAIVLIETALSRMPGDPEVQRRLAKAHRDVGYRLLLAGEKEQAMDHFKQFLAVATREQSKTAVQNLVLAHCTSLQKRGREAMDGGDGAAAEAVMCRLTELMPESAIGFFELGLARLSQKKLAPALESFEAALRLGRADDEDVSLYMLPLLDTLQLLGRGDEAKTRGAAFLAKPGNSDPKILAKIRALID